MIGVTDPATTGRDAQATMASRPWPQIPVATHALAAAIALSTSSSFAV